MTTLICFSLFCAIPTSFCAGKMQSLARPMVLTNKEKTADGHVQMEIQAVIRKKILFSTRPTPLKKQSNSSAANQVSAATTGTLGEKRRL